MDYSATNKNSSNNENTTPICRCRVMYLGSSVPHLTKDGLQGVQEPLKELYPESGIAGLNLTTGAGIDSWISVWSNGILIENVDDFGREVRRFFPIESLHYCAAVRFVNLPNNTSASISKFLPLDSPFLRHAKSNHPPLFACILRRTTGIKVLECHAFVCKRETAANALVRCCFHAYADNEYVKQIDESPYAQINNRNNLIEKNDFNNLDDQSKFNSSWDSTDVTNSDNNTSSTQQQKSSGQSSATNNNCKIENDCNSSNNHNSKTNCFNDINSDTEVMTTNSSLSQNSPEEEEIPVNNNYFKIWPTSKSLSGSIKNLNLNKHASKINKGASMRSLKPRQMMIPNILAPPMPSLVPVQTVYKHQFMDKPNSKLLKKMKSKSMITLVSQPGTPLPPPPPHAIPIGQPIYTNKQGQQFIQHPQIMMMPNIYGHPTIHQVMPPMIPIAATQQPITDETDHQMPNHQSIVDLEQHFIPPISSSMNGNGLSNQQRKLSQNGLNNSLSNNSPSSVSIKQQQLHRNQILKQQQQMQFQQQQQLNAALNALNINSAPKTASIKRSKLNNNNLFHNGQLNGNNNISKLKEVAPPAPPKLFNDKLVLPTQNGILNGALLETSKKKMNGKLVSGH